MSIVRSLSVIILAAGQGKRLGHPEGKMMVPIAGKRLIDFPIRESLKAIAKVGVGSIGVVVGHKKEALIDYVTKEYKGSKFDLFFPEQGQPLGTGDAVRAYFNEAKNVEESDYTIVMCGDTPLVRSEHIQKLLSKAPKLSDITVATFDAKNPFGLGRIVRDGNEKAQIVEEKDASDDEKKICEVNSGLFLFRTRFLKDSISKLTPNNKAKEYYLTDLLSMTDSVDVEKFDDENSFKGVNDVSQLSELQKDLFKEKIKLLMEKRVKFIDPDSSYIDYDVEIGEGTEIYPQVMITGQTKIGGMCLIENGSIIKNSRIGNQVVVNGYSYIEDSTIGDSSAIGPFARLRPSTHVGEKCKIGNFVETKKAELEKGVKISHLSYVGDAEVGAEANIGCGFITCNYDGANKHKTKIGQGTFIGSDCQAVAPVEIGKNSFIAAGTTITNNVPDEGFAIGRARQVTKEGMAKRFLKKK